MSKIIDYNTPSYVKRIEKSEGAKWNGAYYYAKEIIKNIIPNVNTDRNWVLVNQEGECLDHSIVFIHNNKNPKRYTWLKGYKDLVLVCGVRETMPKVEKYGDHVIYLPLSIDVEEVQRYKRPKSADVAYVGRRDKMSWGNLPICFEILAGLPREQLLPGMARYKEVYAVGRCAIEAKALGCKVLPYDPRFPDPGVWEVLDNREAAKILQKELDKIDGHKSKKRGNKNGIQSRTHRPTKRRRGTYSRRSVHRSE